MTSGRPAGRRVVGIAVLLLAVLVVAGLGRVPGHRVTGHPVAIWPQPPPVGSCLDLDGGRPRTVPCSRPHDGEVTLANGPRDPMVTDTARYPLYDPCATATATYLGSSATPSRTPSPGWDFPPLAYHTEPVDAPPGQRAGRYGWTVCLVRPAVPARYTGIVRRIPAIDVPAAYRTCLDHRNAIVSCLAPHATEVLAVQVLATRYGDDGVGPRPSGAAAGDSTAGPTARGGTPDQRVAARLGECRTLAARLAGTDDPTYGGLLDVGVSGLSGALAAGGDAALACIAQVRDGRRLTGSVVGRGDSPPPLTDR